MQTSQLAVHPLFDPSSLCFRMHANADPELRMQGFLHFLKGWAKYTSVARPAPAPAPPFLTGREPSSDVVLSVDPVEVFVFLADPSAAPGHLPAAPEPVEAGLVLLQGPEGGEDLVGLGWPLSGQRGLKAALRTWTWLSGPLHARALLFQPEALANLSKVVGLPHECPADSAGARELLRRVLAAQPVRDVLFLAQLLAAGPDFEGEIDAEGTPRFLWFQAPSSFKEFPPRSRPLPIALLIQPPAD